jgi:hypothetical protein
MRKEAGFAVTDRISIAVRAEGETGGQLLAMKQYICSETLAEEFSMEFEEGEFTGTFDLNGVNVAVGIRRRAARTQPSPSGKAK